jgi:RecG-like helicase
MKNSASAWRTRAHQADAQARGRADMTATPIPRTLNMSLRGFATSR